MNHIQSPISTDYRENLNLIATVAGTDDFGLVEPVRDLSMRLEHCSLGSIDIFRYEGFGLHSAKRSRRKAHVDPSDDILVLFPINKPVRLSQCDRNSVVEPGSLCLMSTALPFELQGGEPPDYDYSELFVRIPGSLLRQRSPLIDMLFSVPIPAEHGVCKVVKGLVESIFLEHQNLSFADKLIFGDLLLAAMAMISAPSAQIDTEKARLFEHRNSDAAILARAQAFIDCNLSNADLSMHRIATHCSVSERRLYAIFASSGTTVGQYLRDSRLQQCRAELGDSRLADFSIFEIAMRWGYSNPASFSRAYRAKFGCSPRSERNTPRPAG